MAGGMVKKFYGEVEGSYDWKRGRLQRALSALGGSYWDETGPFYWLRDIFDDTLIAEDESPGDVYEFTWEINDSEVTLGEAQKVKLDYVAKKRRAAVKSEHSLIGPIVRKSEAERLAYAAVLVPGEEDLNGEQPLSKEAVRKFAHGYMEHFRYMDTNHDFVDGAAVPVESYLIPDGSEMSVKAAGEDVTLPEGTWIIGSRISEDAWPKVESGELAGYSITGIPEAAVLAADTAEKSAGLAVKNLLLEDLENPVIGIVSLVDKPAVPKAKWFALKAEAEDEKPARKTLMERLGLKNTIWQEPDTTEGEEDMAGLTEERITEIVADSASKAVDARLKEAGVLKEEPSDTDKILGAINGLTEALNNGGVGAGAAASEADTAEKSEGEGEGEENVATLKAQIAEKDDLLEKATKALNRVQAGSRAIEDEADDDEPASTGGVERDMYGRRVR